METVAYYRKMMTLFSNHGNKLKPAKLDYRQARSKWAINHDRDKQKKKNFLTKDFANVNAPSLLIRRAVSLLFILKLHLPLAHTNSVQHARALFPPMGIRKVPVWVIRKKKTKHVFKRAKNFRTRCSFLKLISPIQLTSTLFI